MSIYELNSIVKKIDEKNLSDISDVLNKKDIWIKHSLSHTERMGWHMHGVAIDQTDPR